MKHTKFEERITLIAKAFSAGGVLVGAAVNRIPGLFDKVVLTNAFVDVFNTMTNRSLFLTEHEYDEFGDPTEENTNPATATSVRSYCPMYNLKPELHTSTSFFLIGTIDDPNVPYWNATLYFKKLSLCNDGKHVFLEMQREGGHNFTNQNRIEVLALENSFILR